MTAAVLDGPSDGDLAADFDAVSSPQRLAILRQLVKPSSAEDIAAALGMTRQAAHRHIRKLRDRGFIRVVPGRIFGGAMVAYVVATPPLFALSVAAGDLAKLSPRAREDSTASNEFRVSDNNPDDDHLRLVSGPDDGMRFFLNGGRQDWAIGTDPSNHLRLRHDPFVGIQHAVIHRTPEGYVLAELEGNAVTVDYEGLSDKGVTLAVGNIIRIGRSILVYQNKRPVALRRL